MSMPTVLSIIIPVFNRWELTAQCLHSLAEHTHGGFFEVVVVDNGSTDATRTQLKPLGEELFGKRFLRVQLLKNRNFGPGCNQGAEAAAGRLLLFLNNDTLATEGWFEPLLKAFTDHPRLGAAGPLLLYPDQERVQHLGIAFSPTLQTEHLYANFPASHPAVTAERPLQAITGAAMIVRADLFRELGGFHEGYVNGSEDMDLCARIRERGKKIACIPESRIVHLESQTPGRFDHDTANAALLKERCQGLFAPDLHSLAARDGFCLALSACLENYLVLAPERERELDAVLQSSGTAPMKVWELLQKEPLWRGGYAWLARQLEAGGAHADAVGLRTLQAYFFPDEKPLLALTACALKAGDLAMAQEAGEKLARIKALKADGERLVKTARAVADWAAKADEPEIKALYEAWLETNGGGAAG